MGQAYLQVLEGNKFLIPEEIPTQERTAFHGAAAAAAKAGKSHFDFKGKKYPATMKKDTAHAITSDTQKEAADLDAKNVGKMVKHDCATHVEHAEFGEGVCIPGEHTLVETSEGEGYVTHYDVLFDHGIEKDVMVEDLKVTKSEAHIHAGKKLVKKEKNTTDTEVQTQEEIDYDEIASYLLDEGIDVDDLTEEQLDEVLGMKTLGKGVKAVAKGVGSLAKKAVVNKQGNVRFSTAGKADAADAKANKLDKKIQDRERLKAAQKRIKSAQRKLATKRLAASTNEANEIEEKATAQHKPDDATRDTYEKQLKTRKGEKDFVDQHKSEVPLVADEPKIDAMNFKTFKVMTKKSPARSADQSKGDTAIKPSGTPIKDPAAPKIREQSEQLDELSPDTLKRYREKAIKDKEKQRQSLQKTGFPKMSDPDSKHKKFQDTVKRKDKRDAGIDRSWKKLVDKGAYKGRKPGEYGTMLVPHQQPKGKKG